MIHKEIKDKVCILRFKNGKVNTLDLNFLNDLNDKIEKIDFNSSIGIVLTGEGHTFSAGVDLYKILEDKKYVEKYLPLLTSILIKLFKLPCPLVCAVNGHAIAAGCFIALTCDYRIMCGDRGKIGMPEVLVGVSFPTILLELMRFTVPKKYIHEVVYTGKLFTAEEAIERGLIDEVTELDQLLPLAIEQVKSFSKIPKKSFEMTKRQIRLPSVELFEKYSKILDEEVIKDWTSEGTQKHIKEYIDKATKKTR